MNPAATSSSLNPLKPHALATSPYCCAIARFGVNRVPNASKQMRRFRFAILYFEEGNNRSKAIKAKVKRDPIASDH